MRTVRVSKAVYVAGKFDGIVACGSDHQVGGANLDEQMDAAKAYAARYKLPFAGAGVTSDGIIKVTLREDLKAKSPKLSGWTYKGPIKTRP